MNGRTNTGHILAMRMTDRDMNHANDSVAEDSPFVLGNYVAIDTRESHDIKLTAVS